MVVVIQRPKFTFLIIMRHYNSTHFYKLGDFTRVSDHTITKKGPAQSKSMVWLFFGHPCFQFWPPLLADWPFSRTRICASLGLRTKFKTLFMSDNGFECWVYVFKFVSCKPGAFMELAPRPPRPEKLTIFLINHSLCYCS